MKRMKARYFGMCVGCTGQIKPGDSIVFARKGETYHANCAPSHNSRADREYWAGRAAGERRARERAIYGDEMVEQWDREEEFGRYVRGLDD